MMLRLIKIIIKYYEIWASSYSTLRNWSVHLFIWVKMKLTQISNDKLLKPVDL